MPKINRMDREMSKTAAATGLHCVECRREWAQPQERWRMYTTDEPEPEVGLYCPICAAYEFD
jgi:hypothetical protein